MLDRIKQRDGTEMCIDKVATNKLEYVIVTKHNISCQSVSVYLVIKFLILQTIC